MSKPYVGDVGTELIVDCGVALAGATTVELLILKPGATAPVTKTGAIYQTTCIRYVTIAGDLSVPGRYRVQAHVHLGAWSGLGETCTFQVSEAFT